ncbi:MAG: hypothetical protein ACI8ZN_002457 [Bacteroidia bacterium]|jgi:hypothetical protein
MDNQGFEQIMREKLYDSEAQAPDVLQRIYKKRTGIHIFLNRVALNKTQWLVAASVVLLVAVTGVGIANYSSRTAENPAPAINDSNPTGQGSVQNFTESNPANTTQNDIPLVADEKENTDVTRESVKEITTPSVVKNNPTKTGVSGGQEPRLNETPIVKNQDFTRNPTLKTPNTTEPNESDYVVTPKTEDKPFLANIDKEKAVETTTSEDKSKPVEKDKLAINKNEDTDGSGDLGTSALPSPRPLSKWSMSLLGGPSYAFRNISNSDGENLGALRNSSEKAQVSLQARFMLNYALSQNVEAYIGLDYLKRRETMSFGYSSTTTNMNVNSRTITVVRPNGPPTTTTVYDTSFETQTVDKQARSNNSYQYVSLPIGLRFTGYKGKFGFSVSADAALVLQNSYRGYVLDSEQGVLTNLNNGSFKRSITGTSMCAAFGVSYFLTPRFTGIFEPRATYFLSPTNGFAYRLNQYDYAYTANFGLKYKF